MKPLKSAWSYTIHGSKEHLLQTIAALIAAKSQSPLSPRE